MIEILTFRLAKGADVDAFLAADKLVQSDFAYQQPGLVRRTTARGADGDWVVIDLWASADHADACEGHWGADSVTQAFMSFVDPRTVKTACYSPLD